jgi:trimethylamine:corrinoid methyltransferase-like protein
MGRAAKSKEEKAADAARRQRESRAKKRAALSQPLTDSNVQEPVKSVHQYNPGKLMILRCHTDDIFFHL